MYERVKYSMGIDAPIFYWIFVLGNIQFQKSSFCPFLNNELFFCFVAYIY